LFLARRGAPSAGCRYRDDETSTIQSYIVTENGISDASDVMRPAYIVEHLLAVARAVDEGVPVSGYLHWTISDNWEWADGYCPKFGLVDVDRADNLRRHRRPSFALFRDIVAKRRVTVPQREDAWAQVQAAVAAGATHRFCRADDGQSSLDAAIERPFSDKDWRFSAAEAEVDRQKEARSQTQKHTSAVTDSVAEVTSTINQTIWGMWDSIPGQDEVNAGVYNTLNDTMLGLGHAIWGNWLDSNEEVLEAAVVEGREV